MRQIVFLGRSLASKLADYQAMGASIHQSGRAKVWPIACAVLLTGSAFLYGEQLSPKQPLAERNVVYVQASKGSFNHQAVSYLNKVEEKGDVELSFSGTPSQVFERAAANKSEAFVALRNDLVPGNLIAQTVQAMTRFKVNEVTGAVRMPIHMCLIRSSSSTKSNAPLEAVSSHPSALLQVRQWIKANKVEEISDEIGTSSAAAKVSAGELPETTGAVGSCLLAETCSRLQVTEWNLEDSAENTTLFGRLVVKERPEPVSIEQAKTELQTVITKAEKRAVVVP